MISVSEKGKQFIKDYEKLRLHVYDDGFGYQTIGWGHLVQGDELGGLESITKQDAEEIFEDDLDNCVEAIKDFVKVELSQDQVDALASFIFNVGAEAFHKSTLLKKLNNEDFKGAANEFPKWNKSKGQVVRGLVRRRKAEQEVFLSANT